MRTEATPGKYHPVVYMLHLAALLKTKNIATNDYNTMDKEIQKPIEAEATKSSKGAYLACLFLLMADEDRYRWGGEGHPRQ